MNEADRAAMEDAIRDSEEENPNASLEEALEDIWNSALRYVRESGDG